MPGAQNFYDTQFTANMGSGLFSQPPRAIAASAGMAERQTLLYETGLFSRVLCGGMSVESDWLLKQSADNCV